MHPFVILNPVAGTGEPQRVVQALNQYLGEDKYGVYRTTGSAEEDVRPIITRALDAGYDTVVAAGGDGTVTAAVDAVAGRTTPLGIIPTGSGNALARGLNIPQTPEAACALLAGNHVQRPIDALQVDDRHYILRLGLGFQARVLRQTERNTKRLVGALGYYWTALRNVMGWNGMELTITADGYKHTQRRIALAAVVNCATLGAPGVDIRWGAHIQPDDGRVEVCLVQAKSLLSTLRVVWRAVRGQTRQADEITYLPAYHDVLIEAATPQLVHGDGEIIGTTPLHAKVVPHAVHLIVPAA